MSLAITITTDFDCTMTGIVGHFRPSQIPFVTRVGLRIENQAQWIRARNQQRNWETITQLISLFAQPQDLSAAEYNSETQQWTMNFWVETPGIFEADGDPVKLLKVACQGVPMITGLGEAPGAAEILIPDTNIFIITVDK